MATSCLSDIPVQINTPILKTVQNVKTVKKWWLA